MSDAEPDRVAVKTCRECPFHWECCACKHPAIGSRSFFEDDATATVVDEGFPAWCPLRSRPLLVSLGA
jgi:hypothetical protein